MSNFFSAPWFIEAAAAVLLPGQGVRPGTVEVEGRRYDVPMGARGRVPRLALVDFYEERGADDALSGPVMPAAGLSAVDLGSRPVEGAPGPRPEGRLAAPWVDWTTFPTWQDFVRVTSDRQWRAFRQSDRKIRKIGREVGPVRFSMDEPDHDLLERSLMWKSRQLRRTKRLDRFASPRARQLLHRLVAEVHLRLAVLEAGGRPLATQLGHFGEHAHRCWITAYDPALAIYSPGVLLFERLMKDSYDAGHRVFDFLIGDEDYKYFYATHERLVGTVGRPAPADLLARRVRVLLARAEEGPRAARAERLRGAAFELLQGRLQRQAVVRAQQPDPAWLVEVERNTPSWPGPRLSSPEDCQLSVLLAHGQARTTPAQAARDLLLHNALRVRPGVRKLARRYLEPAPSPLPASEAEPVPLAQGEVVRVKDREEIARTLQNGKLEGLYYIPQVMDRFTGRAFRVERRVGRFYDERSQRVVRPRHAIALAGVFCDGAQLLQPGGCDRGCLVYWHEAWLERVEVPAEPPPAPPARDTPGPWQQGDRVRIRPAAEILAMQAADPAGGDGIHFSEATMGAFCGREAVVSRRLVRAYDERRHCFIAISGAVLLDGASCPGVGLTTGGRCERGCALFWRDEWLEPA